MQNIINRTSLLFVIALSVALLYAHSDNNDGWEETKIGHFVLGKIAYQIYPYIVLNRQATTPIMTEGNGMATIVPRWRKQYPDTLNMTHIRLSSNLSGRVDIPEELEIKEGGDYILLRPVATINPIPFWHYPIREIEDFAFADVERYSSRDEKKDSLVFHPTEITEINYQFDPFSPGIGRYAFAYCTKLKQLSGKIGGNIMHGAFWGCRNLAITLSGYSRCDTLIADTLRRVNIEWKAPNYDYPIVGYADTLTVPKGCMEAYIGWKGIPAGIVIEGDYDAATWSSSFVPQQKAPTAKSTIKPPLPILERNSSYSSKYYQFDAEGMIFVERDIHNMLYKDMAFSGAVYTKPSSTYYWAFDQRDGYDGFLAVERQWYGRYTDSLGMARFRFCGFLGENAVVPMSVSIETERSDTLYMSNINTRDRLIHGLLTKKKYHVTALSNCAFADYTINIPLEELDHYVLKSSSVALPKPTAETSNSRLKSLKLPPSITDIYPYALAYCKLLTEHYELPKLEFIYSDALIGCRNLSISIPANCFCQKYIADSLRKVIVKWDRPNNDFPICHYVDTLVVPQGTKDFYANWQGVTAGLILEEENPPSGTQPIGRIVTAVELIEDDNTNNQEDDRIYNLQGQHLNAIPSKGIYIHKGRKYVAH